MFQQYLTDTLKNTDRKKNFPTKQADTISKRNKQTNLSNETALSLETRTFQAEPGSGRQVMSHYMPGMGKCWGPIETPLCPT